MRASVLILPLAACVTEPGGYARLDEVPEPILRYLPAGAAPDDLRVREGCVYVSTADGIVPVARGRVELLCNPTGLPLDAAPAGAPAAEA
ncbi:MAG: hypothetical protein ACU0BS_14295 [Hasllibacter sp.]